DVIANGEEPSSNGSVAISDVDESMLQRRDEMLAPVEEQLAKKLKRVLQDEQNELLDRIRVTTGALSGLAHDAAAHASPYAPPATTSSWPSARARLPPPSTIASAGWSTTTARRVPTATTTPWPARPRRASTTRRARRTLQHTPAAAACSSRPSLRSCEPPATC